MTLNFDLAKAIEIYRKTIISILKLLYGKLANPEEEADNLLALEYRFASVMRKDFTDLQWSTILGH